MCSGRGGLPRPRRGREVGRVVSTGNVHIEPAIHAYAGRVIDTRSTDEAGEIEGSAGAVKPGDKNVGSTAQRGDMTCSRCRSGKGCCIGGRARDINALRGV